MSDLESQGRILPALARDSVAEHFGLDAQSPDPAPDGYLGEAAGVFVTIRNGKGELRGCRGTIQPQYENVIEETRRLALSSALQDTRFDPVCVNELEELTYEVSVLHAPEAANSLDEFDASVYGIIVRDEHGRRALMLPNVDGLDTVEKQYQATCRKGGIDPAGDVHLERFRVDKFSEA